MKIKLKIILSFFILMVINNHACAYAGNCSKNLNKTGYVTSVYLGVDDNKDARITFGFKENNSNTITTISLYNYITGTDNKFTNDSNASKNAQAAYAMLLTAYTSGSPVKIMRCYSDGVVGFGIGQFY
ncbi:hypothetical protein [Xenorhabdus hominickii]|uniref:Uncharacterized protein n=1 Tax=Xenorhabdus hominickii TaxID=351679 RepID=A0A2G0QDV6_XENHO|nr:hypothetical protein [Xenorhabdus hominickii]AOM41483.1 hypothetical protein A9255_13400 [Xenorhabdus hominickii]PHM57414.1 hypothetical protein Xhom_00381 [Xenorhabdus hominickii]